MKSLLQLSTIQAPTRLLKAITDEVVQTDGCTVPRQKHRRVENTHQEAVEPPMSQWQNTESSVLNVVVNIT